MTPKKFGLYVHGQYTHTSNYFDVVCPFKRDNPIYPNVLGQVSYLKKEDTNSREIYETILTGAHETFEQLQKGFFSLPDRIAFLKRLYQKISDQGFGLADLISREVAKPITLARAEVERTLLTLKYTIESATEVLDSQLLDFSREHLWSRCKVKTLREPKGPVLAITPFNFPLNLVMHKLAPAIAAGCPVILKPSPKGLITALALVDLCHSCELPAGMLCFVPCDNSVALDLARDPRVKIVSFTGSSKVGWPLKAALNEKSVFLELGGTAPVYIHEDCEQLERAANQLTQSAFGFAGQSCISAQNVFVNKNIFERFQKLLLKSLETLVWSDPQNEKAVLSAVIDFEAKSRVEQLILEAKSEGAEVLFEGHPNFVSDSIADQSPLVKPTLLLHPSQKSRIYTHEAFAPIMNLHSVDNAENFIIEANSYSHRLQAAVYTQSSQLIEAAQTQLNYGGVIINLAPSTRVDAAAYGGEGLAGVGREGPRYAMEDFTRLKTVVSAL